MNSFGKGIATIGIWVSPFAFHAQGIHMPVDLIAIICWGLLMTITTGVIWTTDQ